MGATDGERARRRSTEDGRGKLQGEAAGGRVTSLGDETEAGGLFTCRWTLSGVAVADPQAIRREMGWEWGRSQQESTERRKGRRRDEVEIITRIRGCVAVR